MHQRHISNDIPLQPLSATPAELLLSTLEQLVRDVPPLTGHSGSQKRSGGLFTGYTGLAYLFLHVSAAQPDLLIAGQKPIEWAARYLDQHDQHRSRVEAGNCGIGSERLSHDAVKACLTRDANDVKRFLEVVNLVIASSRDSDAGEIFPSELATGKAGLLYMLRMVKHWVSGYEAEIDEAIKAVARLILHTDNDGNGHWLWHGKRYFGAAHGDIGIITQLVLSIPSLASDLTNKLEELLDFQLEDGNFPSSSRSLEKGKSDLVQWCHGATGFVFSLQAIRPYFAKLESRIDDAIEKAQRVIWEKGLLVKQPCLCHGIFGNALALPTGEQRNHFLSVATPSSVHRIRKHDPTMFEQASYGKDAAVLMKYLPSAVWTWLVCEQEHPKLVMYTDV